MSGTNQLVPDTLSGAVENLFSGLTQIPARGPIVAIFATAPG